MEDGQRLVDQSLFLLACIVVTLLRTSFPDSERKPDQWFSECTIISCKNDVDHLNSKILGMFPREQKIMQSTDSLVTESPDEIQNAMTGEFLNSITVSGFSLSHLALKVGSLMLLCNLDPSNGLCNWTYLILTRFKPHVLECRIISGVGSGNTVLIPRISLEPSVML